MTPTIDPCPSSTITRRRLLRSAAIGWATLLLVITAGLASVATAPAAIAWGPATVVDPATGDEVEAVVEVNERGFVLAFFRNEQGAVAGVFRLPPGEGDFLDVARPPVLGIEGHTPQQVFVSEAGLTAVVFPAWNGDGEALTGILRDLMEGQRVAVTYFLDGGGYKETSFSLAGAAAALAAAYGIPARVSPEQRRQAQELEEALLEVADGCARLKGKKKERCLELIRACHRESETAAALRSCAEG